MFAIANVPAGPFQFAGSFYYYNGGVPGNNGYCLYAAPPANSSQLPIMDPQSIAGATEQGMCGGGSPPALDFTYAGNYYYYNGGVPGNNGYCLQPTVPPNAAQFPVLNPQSIPGATEQGMCGGGNPPALDFTYAGNYYYYNGGAPGNNGYCLQPTVPANAAHFPVLNPQSIVGATEQGMCGGVTVPAGPFTYMGNYYFNYGSGAYCQYAAPPADAADVPVISPQSITGGQLSGTCGPATLPTYTGGTSGSAAVALNRGALNFQFGGSPTFGLGWTTVCPQQAANLYGDMLGTTGFQTARVPFPLGANVYGLCGAPGSWNGNNPTDPASFDFSYLDSLLARIASVKPDIRIILQVALDGSLAWVYGHPDCAPGALPVPSTTPTAVPNPVPAGFACLSPAEQYQRMVQGIPDYLSPQWVSDSTLVLDRLVSHIQSSAYAANVVGYEMMNGSTLDNGYPVSYTSPSARMRFQSFLGQTYSTPALLASAWQQPGANFQTTQPMVLDQQAASGGTCPPMPTSDPGLAVRSQLAPLFIPSALRAYADTRQFTVSSNQQVTFNFADAIKSATQGQALVGVRSGEFLQQSWCNEAVASPVQYRTADFYSYPSIDFYEVWEHYLSARSFGVSGGSGEPLMPVQGMGAFNKLYVVQNDFNVPPPDPLNPPQGWDTNPANGYEPTFPASIQKLRRVFVNSLVNGMSEYLWNLSYNDDQPQLLPEWTQEQSISAVAMNADRSRVSDLVYVLDPGMGQYLADAYSGGFMGSSAPSTNGNIFFDQPGPQTFLVQFPMQSWARAGVPYDTLFLNQITSAKPYKVYVFYHTIGLSAAQVQSIKAVLQANRAVGIFIYADGMVDGTGNADPANLGANISALTNMTVTGTTEERDATLSPTPWYVGNGGIVGDIGRWSFTPASGVGPAIGDGLVWPGSNTPMAPLLFPSFSVTDPAVNVIATYVKCGGNPIGTAPNDCQTTPLGAAAIAEEAIPGGGDIIYSASPYVPPGVIRYAVQKAGGFRYSNTEDNLYVDKSFVGIHTMDGTQRDGSVVTSSPSGPSWTIQLSFPTATPLYEVFDHTEYAASATQAIPVTANHTYLFYRGTKAAWQTLGGQ